MEWVIVLVILVVAVLLIRNRNKQQLAQIERDNTRSAELTLVKATASEDITAYGMALQQLDIELGGRELDEGMRADYQRALDAYDISKSSLAAVQTPIEIHNVSMILDDGRYAMECVRARAASQPLPQRRPPCFFDPSHGMSVRDVTWTPPGGTPREVPACELDAERVEAGAEPATRQVMLGSRSVPYWEGGSAYAPWAAGYFASFGLMNAMFFGTVLGAFMITDGFGVDGSSDGSDAGSDAGADPGSDNPADGGTDLDASGGFDSGGFDGGGF